MNIETANIGKKVVLATIAGPELSPAWERAALDVSNVFSHPEHQAHEESVETITLMMSCSPSSRAAYGEAVAEARSRGLLKRPAPVQRLEGGRYTRGC